MKTDQFRPQSGYYADIIEEAAVLMEGLLINHPFVDGNKRMAFDACYVFLDITVTAWMQNQHGCIAESSTGLTKKKDVLKRL